MLEELLAAAASAGVAIREVSLDFRESVAQSGLVVLKGEPVIFLNTGLSMAERLKVIAGALHGMDLDNIYLSPAARSEIEGATAKKI